MTYKVRDDQLEHEILAMARKHLGKGTTLRTRRDNHGLVLWIATPSNKQAMAARTASGLYALLRERFYSLPKQRYYRTAEGLMPSVTNPEAKMNSNTEERVYTQPAYDEDNTAWVTADVVERATGYSVGTVWRLGVKDGHFPFRKGAGSYGATLYDKAAAVAYLEKRKAVGGAMAPRRKRVPHAKGTVGSGQVFKGDKKIAGAAAKPRRDAGTHRLGTVGADRWQPTLPSRLRGRLERYIRAYSGPWAPNMSQLLEHLITDGMDRLEKNK